MFTRNDIVPFVDDIRKNIYGFDKIFDDMIHRPGYYLHGDTFPKDNVIHCGENLMIIELALAGYNKEDITIEREETFLSITGQKVEPEVEEEEKTYTRRNIAYRSFTKSYPIAGQYKTISAEFKNGILRIRLEKEEEEETKQLIEIQ